MQEKNEQKIFSKQNHGSLCILIILNEINKWKEKLYKTHKG